MLKRTASLLCIFILLLTSCAAPSSAKKSPTISPTRTEHDPDNISTELAYEIRKSYAAYEQEIWPSTVITPAEEIIISKYHGDQNGYHIVQMSEEGLQTTGIPQRSEAAGYLIYSESNLYAYKTGTFYLLAEVYEQGLLTKRNIYDIGTMVDPTFKERYPAFEK